MNLGRDIVATVAAADSPLGQVARAVDVLSSHLPTPRQPRACPFCLASRWPCRPFLDTAQHITDHGVDAASLVPRDLHQVLWPDNKPATRAS
ncbi:hypothetical protein [Actinokineospora globicatena]|uniref:hypothetical protein n=1 Tax=Actinokineospora globicatena TaxID=103729 RepID=UPI0020A4E6AF|nr:hypothetical protein [Actinokineospora globicatena]MCP2304106.1 hypothetical protein [Actinokineospora globicatena]GLW78542.1 hypothetical protein Aglo01_30240 [Actinokineospora globicatena]GLW84794.1 hypothetical protein Aglo02_24340 [Actinokineospora globicatena]